jgi:hypothetical protein
MHGKAWRDAVFDPFVEIVPATPSRFGLLVFVSLRPSATMCLLGQQARQNPSRDVREHSLSTKVIKKKLPLVRRSTSPREGRRTPTRTSARRPSGVPCAISATGVLHTPRPSQQGLRTDRLYRMNERPRASQHASQQKAINGNCKFLFQRVVGTNPRSGYIGKSQHKAESPGKSKFRCVLLTAELSSSYVETRVFPRISAGLLNVYKSPTKSVWICLALGFGLCLPTP